MSTPAQGFFKDLCRFCFLGFCLLVTHSAEMPGTRPGWKLELVAEAPRIKHPSVAACTPDGRIFVAEDPMDITRPAHVPEGRILCLHPDGRTTVFADSLHAVFGMQYLEGKLYVLHNPKFSVFTDNQGVGRDRVDLIEQTNPNPWALDWNDHVPANFRLGLDGRFYVAVGDKGLFGAVGKDGKRIDLHGGGILRFRPDGTELEIYSTGVRNILDVALTDEDEIFTYDNTDENQWMGRVTHMVDGGFYGYPFDFIPRRPYTLWMLADFGAGAATGTSAVNDDAWPAAYRGNLLLSDFGQRNVRRVQIEREGASFKAVADEQLFVNPPGDFRPVGITFSDDGLSIYICDWQHRDTKENAIAGRLWKLSWSGQNFSKPRPSWYQSAALGQAVQIERKQLLEALAHPARSVRLSAQRQLIRAGLDALPDLKTLLESPTAAPLAKIAALWAADQIDSGKSLRLSIMNLTRHPDLALKRQAIRQLGNRNAREAVRRSIDLLRHPDASIRFQAATALGRIGDASAVEGLLKATAQTDLFARYAAFHALNRIGLADAKAWPAILQGFRDPEARVREATGFAVRETFAPALVEALAKEVRDAMAPGNLETKLMALRVLAPLHHKPPEWLGEWWAYHPFRLSPPAKTNYWEGTATVLAVLRETLKDPQETIRETVAEELGKIRSDDSSALLLGRFDEETSESVRKQILKSLATTKYPPAGPLAARLINDRARSTPEVMLLAKAAGTPEVIHALQQLIKNRPMDNMIPEAITTLAELNSVEALPLIQETAKSGLLPARISAIRALSKFPHQESIGSLARLLEDPSLDVRTETLRTIARLKSAETIPMVLKSWKDPALKEESIRTLARTPNLRALEAYLEGLETNQAELQAASRTAIDSIKKQALPELLPRFKNFSPNVIGQLQQVYRESTEPGIDVLFALQASRPDREVYFEHGLKNEGDRARGEKIFKAQTGVACIKCHRVKGEGIDIGPDLSGVGAQFDRKALAESVLWPSRAVREGYNVVRIELKDGEEVSGMIRAETSEAVSLQTTTGAPQTIPKTQIKNRHSSTLSLMPEGLEAGFSLEDFADLLAYLGSLRSGN